MNNIMKIIKSLEETSLLIKDISETIQNEAKEQKGEFLSMLLVNLGASLLGNLLTGKGAIRAFECIIKKHNKKVLLAKTKLNSMEVLISEAFIDGSISHGEVSLINNVLKEYDDLKEQIKGSRI